ncbi:MAG: HRDC domain-containing protein [Rhodomicrobium sp.]
MQLRVFSIAIHDAGGALDELNSFLRANRVLSVDRHFVPDGANSIWAICVSYLNDANRPLAAGAKRPKVDYREVLSEADFAVFAKLRNLRKELAEREGIPAYALFNNEQLAEMVQRRVGSLNAMKEIEGVGDSRIEKYGTQFLALLKAQEVSLHNGSGSAHDAG